MAFLFSWRSLVILLIYLRLSSCISEPPGYGPGSPPQKTCVVPANEDGSDDAPAILSAFSICGHGGRIVFSNTTYHVATVMNTTELEDCEIDIQGTLLWSTNTTYWLNHSLPVGYQNQSSAWFLGGKRLAVKGHGSGTLNGNGEVWYELAAGISNYPGRPHALTIWNTEDSVFEGLRFIQSQMWTMTVFGSRNVLLQDIYVNNTSNSGSGVSNTDGANTIYSDQIVFRRWSVDNGDDCIAVKANSTNILVEDSVFYQGQGFAVGSIGQYPGVFETIQNVTVRNITSIGTKYAAYVKTWTGVQENFPPNGGGGGLGFLRNLVFDNIRLSGGRSSPISFTQCTSFSGVTGNCDTSLFEVADLSFTNIQGNCSSAVVASMQCSKAAGGCERIRIENISVVDTAAKPATLANEYLCTFMAAPIGFNCTGNVTSNSGGS